MVLYQIVIKIVGSNRDLYRKKGMYRFRDKVPLLGQFFNCKKDFRTRGDGIRYGGKYYIFSGAHTNEIWTGPRFGKSF